MIAAIPIPTPAPTLPPEIGHVTVRSRCGDAQKTLLRALPLLMRNDNTITGAMKGMAKIDSTQDAPLRMALLRTRNFSISIFNNLDKAKEQSMQLHVLAAASTNADQSKQFSDIADSIDAIIAQQNTVADQLNGYVDTSDMALMSKGDDTERTMSAATGPGDTQNFQSIQQRRQRQGSMADSNIGALTTNVYRDLLDKRQELGQTENQTTQQVRSMMSTCAAPRRKP
ncbi:MAG: hypothetical protein GIW97_04250 [Candidatus Eremiobacteraeota bacterium]|nr:hypothetical protein [Candidatus Eremiobacteraeota bacterium]